MSIFKRVNFFLSDKPQIYIAINVEDDAFCKKNTHGNIIVVIISANLK